MATNEANCGTSTSISTPKGKRGLYRCKIRTPRQTVCSRRLKTKVRENQMRLLPTVSYNKESPDAATLCNGENQTSDANNENPLNATGIEHPFTAADFDHLSNAADVDEFSDDSNMSYPKLFAGSILTSRSSELAIRSFFCKHHLNTQAQEDLLQLLQLHVPESKLIPSSIYSLKQKSTLGDTITEQSHHVYCPRCHMYLPNMEYELCPNDECATILDYDSLPGFFTLSIANQIQNLLRSKFCMIEK